MERDLTHISIFEEANDLLVAYNKTIKTFCPNILLNEIINKENITSYSRQFRGACMIADISGFTKLAGKLGKDGSKGLDNLRRGISKCLSAFIHIIYAFDGDVVAFAGDSLVCVFQPTSNYMTGYQCCWRAVQCGIALKDLETENLTAHVAISYGCMSLALLGGYHDNWSYLVTGQCIDALSSCLKDARRKELVASAMCVECLSDKKIDAIVLKSGNFRIDAITPMPEINKNPINRFEIRYEESDEGQVCCSRHVLSFLPPPVVSSMYAASFSTIAELREVTTMFLKLESYSRDCDAIDLQPFFLMAQRCISMCGGFMRQFVVDDKGCVLIALWGVPSACFSNNSYRAVLCARDILLKTRSQGHACSIGVTTGISYCGTIGSSLRRDYVAMGDSVNTAARLMGEAHGRLLIDENTHTSLPKSLRGCMEKAESLWLKGKEEPQIPYVIPDMVLDNSRVPYTQASSLSMWSSMDELDDDSMSILDIPGADRGAERDTTKGYDYCSMSSNLSREIEISLRRHLVELASCYGRSSGCHEAKTILIEGSLGMGKTTVAEYFRQLSHRRKVRCYFVTVEAGDRIKEYGVMRKLFVALVGRDYFDTYVKQQKLIWSLLRATYPELSEDVLARSKFPELKAALDLKWNLQLDTLQNLTLAPDSNGLFQYLRGSRSRIFSRKTFSNTLFDVLLNLLMMMPSTIIVDNMHDCDPATWRELTRLSTMNIPLVVLLTMGTSTKSQQQLLVDWKRHAAPLPEKDLLNAARGSGIGNNRLMSNIRGLWGSSVAVVATETSEGSSRTSCLHVEVPSVEEIKSGPDTMPAPEPDVMSSSSKNLSSHSIHPFQLDQTNSPKDAVKHPQHLFENKFQRGPKTTSGHAIQPHDEEPLSSPLNMARRSIHPYMQEPQDSPSAASRRFFNTSQSPKHISAACEQTQVTTGSRVTKFMLKPLDAYQTLNILSRVLDESSSDIPFSLVELVQQISSGHPMWVCMLASFIKKIGLDDILKTIEQRESLSVSVSASLTPSEQNSSPRSGADIQEFSPQTKHSVQFTWPDPIEQNQRYVFRNVPYAVPPSNRTTSGFDFVLESPHSNIVYLDCNLLKNCILSIFDALPGVEKTVLKFASIIGVCFSHALLAVISPKELRKNGILRATLHSLERNGFIKRISCSDGEGVMFAFNNHYLREVIYDINLPSDTYTAHLRIAQGLEQLHSKTMHMVYQGLTYHYYMASQRSPRNHNKKLVKYALLAGWQAWLADNIKQFVEYASIAESAVHTKQERKSVLYMLENVMKEVQGKEYSKPKLSGSQINEIQSMMRNIQSDVE